MDKEKKILINRTFLLAFSFVAVFSAFFGDVISPYINGNQDSAEMGMEGASNIWYYFTFFTIDSNILVLIFSSLAFISIFNKNPKLQSIVNNWFFKSTVFSWIFITGVVFNLVLFPMLIINNAHEPAKLLGLIPMFFSFSLFQHVLNPILMTNDFRLTKGINLNEKATVKNSIGKVSLLYIAPIIWLIFSLSMIAGGVMPPQYPFLDFFSDGITKTTIIVNSFICFGIFIFFSLVNVGIFAYSNRKFKE